MLSTPLPALAGAVSPRVREKREEQEMLGNGVSHPQQELLEMSSLWDQGTVSVPGKGC